MRHEPALIRPTPAHPANREDDQANEESHANKPTPQPVDVFPPEDLLEAIHRQRAEVLFLVLTRLFVDVKEPDPLAFRERRECAREDVPFHDAQARLGEPRNGTDDRHGENQGR